MIRVMFSASANEKSVVHATMLLLGKMLEAKVHVIFVYHVIYILLMISSQCPVNNCYDAVLGLLTCAEFIEVNKLLVTL